MSLFNTRVKKYWNVLIIFSWVCDHTSAWQSWVSADHTGAALGGKLDAEFEVKMVPYGTLLRCMASTMSACGSMAMRIRGSDVLRMLQSYGTSVTTFLHDLEMSWGTAQKSLTTLPWLPLPRTEKVIQQNLQQWPCSETTLGGEFHFLCSWWLVARCPKT